MAQLALPLNLATAEATSGPVRARLEAAYRPLLREDLRLGREVSYVGNKTVPLLRLYRYKEWTVLAPSATQAAAASR